MIDNLVRCEWFSQKSGDASFHQTLESIGPDESGAEDHRNVTSYFPETVKRFLAVHERHGQVEQDQVDCPRLATKNIKRFKTRLSGDDMIPRLAQKALD